MNRVVAENRRLMSMMAEKDRRIDQLESRIEQLLRDTKSVCDEQSRLQKENTTLIRALANITSAKKQEP